MKYAIIIPDGCADEPQESLGGKTPLAGGPHAGDGRRRRRPASSAGRTTCPPSLPAGSDVANLSLLGYDPLEHFTGRAPLEAAAQGIELGPDDWAIRCNLVTIEDQVMRDFTAGHISTEEATRTAGHRARANSAATGCSSSPASAIAICWSIAARQTAAAVLARHPGHAAARPDRQIGARRLSARAGQRSAQPA